MKAYGWAGLAVMIVSEAATLARMEPFWSWNTPIAWTGFVLFADGVVAARRRDSWLTRAPLEFALLTLASIPLWLIFEWFNRFLHNWHYVGLPRDPLTRTLGYAWAFATIWPAIFEAAELVAVWRDGGPARPGRAAAPRSRRWRPGAPLAIAAGAAMLAWPLLAAPAVAAYLAAPVWLGFIFLLDPINRRLGAESLWTDLRARRFDRAVNLAVGGLVCGVLWEFWNYWAGTKWVYTVPILPRVRIFEMPVPGYLGFPAFALECFTMYVFVRALALRLAALLRRRNTPEVGVAAGRTIAL